METHPNVDPRRGSDKVARHAAGAVDTSGSTVTPKGEWPAHPPLAGRLLALPTHTMHCACLA